MVAGFRIDNGFLVKTLEACLDDRAIDWEVLETRGDIVLVDSPDGRANAAAGFRSMAAVVVWVAGLRTGPPELLAQQCVVGGDRQDRGLRMKMINRRHFIATCDRAETGILC